MELLKKIVLVCTLFFVTLPVLALDVNDEFKVSAPIQKRIDEVGFKILNANKLDSRIVFSYQSKQKLIKGNPPITKRQVVVYDKDLKYIENDDELAGFLAREVSLAIRTYNGSMGGLMSSAQVSMSPKKYELVADKRAVDYVVKAGYNPIGLITYVNKSAPQRRFDMFSNHNLTSKRLAYIYERIYTNYPYFIHNNSYIDNEYYQNFLLNSISNRRLLEKKVRFKSEEKIKYE